MIGLILRLFIRYGKQLCTIYQSNCSNIDTYIIFQTRSLKIFISSFKANRPQKILTQYQYPHFITITDWTEEYRISRSNYLLR